LSALQLPVALAMSLISILCRSLTLIYNTVRGRDVNFLSSVLVMHSYLMCL